MNDADVSGSSRLHTGKTAKLCELVFATNIIPTMKYITFPFKRINT